MEFDIPKNEHYSVNITDQLGTPILNGKMFEKLLLKYLHSASFYFKIDFHGNISEATAITPKVCEMAIQIEIIK